RACWWERARRTRHSRCPRISRYSTAGADAEGGGASGHSHNSDLPRNHESTKLRIRCLVLRRFRVFVFSWQISGRDFFDGLVRLRQMQRNQQLDDRPRGVDLARADAELRAARIAVMVVVEP